MASTLSVGAGYVAVLLMAAAVLAILSERERFLFVAGVVLVLIAQTLLSSTPGAVVGLIGVAAMLSAALPMLREPAPST